MIKVARSVSGCIHYAHGDLEGRVSSRHFDTHSCPNLTKKIFSKIEWSEFEQTIRG